MSVTKTLVCMHDLWLHRFMLQCVDAILHPPKMRISPCNQWDPSTFATVLVWWSWAAVILLTLSQWKLMFASRTEHFRIALCTVLLAGCFPRCPSSLFKLPFFSSTRIYFRNAYPYFCPGLSWALWAALGFFFPSLCRSQAPALSAVLPCWKPAQGSGPGKFHSKDAFAALSVRNTFC